MGAALLHVDLDAFFASVEQLLDPSLRGKPVIVGGTGGRGVVAAASYEARRYGVHSAMPTARARRACPEGVFLSPRIDRYQEFSERVFTILRSFTPLVEPVSIDEAFLDVRGARHLYGAGPDVAKQIKDMVQLEVGLTCSVGVATTKLVAKLASEMSKPDGLMVVEAGEELEFLRPLPVERLWGVGPATAAKLARLGIRTVGELAVVPEGTLVAALGDALGHHLRSLSRNEDERTVSRHRDTKSVSAEETFPADIDRASTLELEARRLAGRVGARLRDGGWWGRTVILKVRFGDFRTITRSMTVPAPVQADAEITRTALDLLANVDPSEGVRLLGVGVAGLQHDAAHQEELPFDGGAPRRQVDDALDAVRARFGSDAIAPASFLDSEGIRSGRRTGHDWGPDEVSDDHR